MKKQITTVVMVCSMMLAVSACSASSSGQGNNVIPAVTAFMNENEKASLAEQLSTPEATMADTEATSQELSSEDTTTTVESGENIPDSAASDEETETESETVKERPASETAFHVGEQEEESVTESEGTVSAPEAE